MTDKLTRLEQQLISSMVNYFRLRRRYRRQKNAKTALAAMNAQAEATAVMEKLAELEVKMGFKPPEVIDAIQAPSVPEG